MLVAITMANFDFSIYYLKFNEMPTGIYHDFEIQWSLGPESFFSLVLEKKIQV